MSRQKPAESAAKGGIRPSTPAYLFWMKFLENEIDLRNEFHWRIVNGDGFINWDFLPKKERIGHYHKSTQYRIALECVRETVEACCSNCASTNLHYLGERIEYLRSLKELTDQVLAARKKSIYNHDTLTNRIVESFSAKKPIKSHKEVYEIWVEIRDAIVRSMEVLTNEVQHRERLVQIQQGGRSAAAMQQTERNDRDRPQQIEDDPAESDDCCCVIL